MAAVEALIDRLQGLEAGRGDDGRPRFDGQAASAVIDELTALQAIYGQDSLALLATRKSASGATVSDVVEQDASPASIQSIVRQWTAYEPIRLAISVEVDGGGGRSSEVVRLSAVLPPGYPNSPSPPPQLQILSRYIGPHGVDHAIFGQIVRIFMAGTPSQAHLHTPFVQGQVALFDGVEKARELIEAWLSARASSNRETEDGLTAPAAEETPLETDKSDVSSDDRAPSSIDRTPTRLFAAPAIVERKSTFLGHAAVLRDPSDVQRILAELLQDRRIARATHPAIFAWTVRTADGVLHRDCDDDGETAAGGRLAHLLDLLRLENVIVIVTRWYGGVLLGPDRFKYINRAARDALQLAGMVDGGIGEGSSAPSKKPPSKTRK